MRDIVWMCEYRQDCVIEKCPCIECAASPICDGTHYLALDLRDVDFGKMESEVINFTKENRDALFPTWQEWYTENFGDKYLVMFMPCIYDHALEDACNKNTCKECRNKPIRAEVAYKLGVEAMHK